MAKFISGNTFGTGQNQFSARSRGGALNVTVDAKAMGARARRVAGMARRADAPILRAHHSLGSQLQEYIASDLTNSVRARGRAQRKKSQSDRLATAIVSKRNRRVNADGYTVGYLESIKAVKPYFRGLEVGTRRHVGLLVPGSFTDGTELTVGGKGLVKLGNKKAFRIKRPIVGYRYFRQGTKAFVSDGFTRSGALGIYQFHLEKSGLKELADTLGGSDVRGAVRSSRGIGGAQRGPNQAGE